MTQEEKAKRYDELLLKLQKAKVDDNVCDEMYYRVINDIVPELKESEDERIRKGIIRNLEYLMDRAEGFVKDELKERIAWLEKQGEQKLTEGTFVNVDDVREDFIQEVYRVLDADPTNDRANQIIDAFDSLQTVTIEKQGENHDDKYNITGIKSKHAEGKLGEMIKKLKPLGEILDKQSEQKQDPCDNCKDVMLNCHNFPCIEKRAFKQGKTALEAINEENVDNANKVETKDYSSIDPHFGKPIDKVEPKFKVKYAGNEYNVLEVKDIAGVTYYGIEDEPNHIDYVLPDNCEIVSELKLADNVEPKFKNGQWIVWQDKCYKVNYNGCGYELVDQNGLSTSLEYGTIDENAHIWDISKDAKAGDVLYSPKGAGVEGIFLIKGWEQVELTGKTLCSSIGYRVEENEIVVSGLGAIWWEGVVDPFYPATKEQRDKFEKAMTDAGYTFDFEREELKKIEDEIEIPFGAKDSELIEESYYIPKGFHAEIDEDKVVIKKGEKPTAWSEEDENIKEWIMSDINKLLALNRKSFVIADKEITWLKSLKGRVGCEVNCTTTKKWSEEDIATISRVISIVKWAAYSDHSHPILNDEGATELVERLKSLKERYTWKPSDEQMDALQYVCRNLNPPLSDKLGWDSLKTLELLYKILKKLY